VTTSLSTAAARKLATTTKSAPQMRAISPRWLLRVLPWVDVTAGTYRVNRRLTYPVGDGRLTFASTGPRVEVIPPELRELPPLRDFPSDEPLTALAGAFAQREFGVGDVIATAGTPADGLFLVAHGKADRFGVTRYGEPSLLGTMADGDYFGVAELLGGGDWPFTVRAVTPCVPPPHNKYGEAAIELASGHAGEPVLPGTFADYELAPREYELSVAQTVLRVHSRVADLYNDPMNQLAQQLRLTIEALRERQEHEMVNNRDFGLLYNADLTQRVQTRTGPPTPDDLDELVSRRRKTRFLFAHPRAIAAFGRECTRRGIYPQGTEIDGRPVMAWRGIPVLPCDKIPISHAGTTSILAMRVGEEANGVIGLRTTGIPDEHEPGLSVRFMGIDDKAIMSYLVSAYFSVAVLVPSALGILENVELGRSA
jgi:hypothetical protein